MIRIIIDNIDNIDNIITGESVRMGYIGNKRVS